MAEPSTSSPSCLKMKAFPALKNLPTNTHRGVQELDNIDTDISRHRRTHQM
jgi:hypothetical protein